MLGKSLKMWTCSQKFASIILKSKHYISMTVITVSLVPGLIWYFVENWKQDIWDLLGPSLLLPPHVWWEAVSQEKKVGSNPWHVCKTHGKNTWYFHLTFIPGPHTCTHVYMFTFTYSHTYMYTYTPVHIDTCSYAYMYTYTACTHPYTYIKNRKV